MSAATLVLALATGARRYDLATLNDRWSPEDATRVELRLNKRLGRPSPKRIAADPAAYAAWRSGLGRAAIQSLLENAGLGRKRGLGVGLLAWRQLTVGERCFILAGVGEHLLEFVLRKPAKQSPDHGAKGNDFAGRNRAKVISRDHPDLSCVVQPGDDAESPAGGTSPAAEREDVQ